MLGVLEGADVHSFSCLSSGLSYTHLTMAKLKGLCSADRLAVAFVWNSSDSGTVRTSQALKGGRQHGPLNFSSSHILRVLQGRPCQPGPAGCP